MSPLRARASARFQPSYLPDGSSWLDSCVLIGVSKAIEEVRARCAEFGPAPFPVFVSGESGTGKSIVAGLIHKHSGLGPFVEFIGGEVPESLVEAELFGSVEGIYTDAPERDGVICQADGGTLFLDELQDLPINALRALRAFLDDRGVRKLGGAKRLRPGVRVIVGAIRSLGEMLGEGSLSVDLAARLYGAEIRIPPLRERREDIWVMAEHFLRDVARRCNAQSHGFSNEAVGRLESRNWIGNGRELERAVQVGFYMARGDVIQPRHLPQPIDSCWRLDGVGPTHEESLTAALLRTGGNVAQTARELGIDPTTVRHAARKFGLDLRAIRSQRQ